MAKRYYDGKSLAKRYLQFRIRYPKALFKYIVDYYDAGRGPNCKYNLAVDVGCGSGQATLPLAEYFSHVIGCDVSEDHVEVAPRDNNKVEFKVCPAEHLDFLADNSVDLLTASAAFHYFDQDAFYGEAKRVLKPGGGLAIFAYGFHILDSEEGRGVFDEFKDRLGKHWLEIKNLDTIYNERRLPFPEWKGIFDNDSFTVREKVSISHLVGTLSTYHAWDMYKAENPQSDYLEQLTHRFAVAYGCEDIDQEGVEGVTQKASLLIGRKPVDLDTFNKS